MQNFQTNTPVPKNTQLSREDIKKLNALGNCDASKLGLFLAKFFQQNFREQKTTPAKTEGSLKTGRNELLEIIRLMNKVFVDCNKLIFCLNSKIYISGTIFVILVSLKELNLGDG